jgi:hypothetical protein
MCDIRPSELDLYPRHAQTQHARGARHTPAAFGGDAAWGRVFRSPKELESRESRGFDERRSKHTSPLPSLVRLAPPSLLPWAYELCALVPGGREREPIGVLK